MQAVIENNDQHLKIEMKQMQDSYERKLQQAQEKEALSAQELNLQYLVAENKMNSTIASLRTHLTESQDRENIFKVNAKQQSRQDREHRGQHYHLYRLHRLRTQ